MLAFDTMPEAAAPALPACVASSRSRATLSESMKVTLSSSDRRCHS
jgi:hypothetical protein